MKRPNALNPQMMTPSERRAELCGLLAFGLVRLHMRNAGQVSEEDGDFPLHNPADQSGHATSTRKETA
ncbi:hypothetical protein [uncultured Roseovarius sp.]|uniref:hypothetical protein n=1 Tax=uncultured Roseovarius sp. TaxID=293344 RepID=UPI00261A13A8|nr:hypothetical protein [uncultured Roseovarius sp.]